VNRSTLVLLTALALLGLGYPNAQTALAQPASLDNSGGDALAESREALRVARERVSDARQEVEIAELGYRKWTQRRRPRGEARMVIVKRLDDAQAELEEAEAALPAAMENARRAGLSPGEFRELEAEVPL